MSEPAPELPAPELDAEDALHGVVNQLIINGQRMPVIIPGSVIEALRVLAVLLEESPGGRLFVDASARVDTLGAALHPRLTFPHLPPT